MSLLYESYPELVGKTFESWSETHGFPLKRARPVPETPGPQQNAHQSPVAAIPKPPPEKDRKRQEQTHIAERPSKAKAQPETQTVAKIVPYSPEFEDPSTNSEPIAKPKPKQNPKVAPGRIVVDFQIKGSKKSWKNFTFSLNGKVEKYELGNSNNLRLMDQKLKPGVHTFSFTKDGFALPKGATFTLKPKQTVTLSCEIRSRGRKMRLFINGAKAFDHTFKKER